MNTAIHDSKDFGQLEPSEQISAFELEAAMKTVLTTLTEREQGVIKLRYFDRLTRKDIGAIYGFSISRVKQIELKALCKMNHPHRKSKLQDFAK